VSLFGQGEHQLTREPVGPEFGVDGAFKRQLGGSEPKVNPVFFSSIQPISHNRESDFAQVPPNLVLSSCINCDIHKAAIC
jgi:hypothetical protein